MESKKKDVSLALPGEKKKKKRDSTMNRKKKKNVPAIVVRDKGRRGGKGQYSSMERGKRPPLMEGRRKRERVRQYAKPILRKKIAGKKEEQARGLGRERPLRCLSKAKERGLRGGYSQRNSARMEKLHYSGTRGRQ